MTNLSSGTDVAIFSQTCPYHRAGSSFEPESRPKRHSDDSYDLAQGPVHSDTNDKKVKTYNRRDSQMVTHSSTSRPVQCLCMAERTGCPVLTDLWSYVLVDPNCGLSPVEKTPESILVFGMISMGSLLLNSTTI